MNNLWFVRYLHTTKCDQIVFCFTLGEDSGSYDALQHGRAMISASYATQYKDAEATILCRTKDVVLCFEPC